MTGHWLAAQQRTFGEIPAGLRGRDEVTEVDKKGMMGKAGQLSVRLGYVRIGDTKVLQTPPACSLIDWSKF